MRTIGLTGGIATGKSTVARMLAAKGASVIDADRIARAVVAPGSPALDRIVEVFGPSVLRNDGSLDRAALRRRIAENASERAALNEITHPRIRERIEGELEALRRAGATRVFVEAALLVETGSYERYPELVVVSARPEVQLARLVARDECSEEDAVRMVATQLPMEAKEAVATEIVRNDGDLEQLRDEVDALWVRLGVDHSEP